MRKILTLLVFTAILAALVIPAVGIQAAVKVDIPTPERYTGYTVSEKSPNNYEIDFGGSESKVTIGNGTASASSKVTFNRWGEFWLSLDMPGAATGPLSNAAKAGDSISFSNSNFGFEYTPVSPKAGFNELGGLDLLITLQKKPAANSLSFNFNAQGVTAYFQPALTAADIAAGAARPDYVVNSIAFYADKKNDYSMVGGKNYKTGKIGHLYRLKAVDAKGSWVWSNWGLAGNTITLTVDQTFLNSATYPVKLTPAGDTFGYTSIGGSTLGTGANVLRVNESTVTGLAGTAVNMKVYASSASGTHNIQTGLYDSSLNRVAYTGNGTVTTTPAWSTCTFVSNPTTSAVGYYLMLNNDDNNVQEYFDSGSQYYRYKSVTFGTWPDPVTGLSTSGSFMAKFSLYVTMQSSTLPTVTTNNATSINFTTAVLNGNITNTGGENCTVRGFWYDTDSGSPYAGNTSESGNFTAGAYSLTASNLTGGTTYYFKAWAQNSAGVGNGTELSFTTLSQAPAVTSDNPTYTSPGDATATLNGNLTSLGDASSSNVSFQWGYTVSYGTNTSPLSRNTTGTYGQNLTGFLRGTTVHYRAMAANGYGTVFGSDKSFSIAANTSAEVGWFQPNAIIQGTTLPDRDTADGAQNGVITWGTNPGGLAVSIGGSEPIATPTATPTVGPTSYPTTNVPVPGLPGGWYDPGTPTFPGADVPGSFEAGSGVTIFWFVFPLILILLLGIFIHDRTKSLFAQALVMGIAICFVSFFHIWPLWMIAPFAMISGACCLAGRIYSY